MLSTFRRYLHEHGVRQTAMAVGRRLLRPFYSELRLIVIVKDLDAIAEPWQLGELRVEDLEARHLAGLSELNRKRGRNGIDRRFARYVKQGFHGFVAYSGDQVVGYYWWVDRDVKVVYPDLRKLGLGIELGPGDVYGSDFFLLEEQRGGGVAADVLFKIERSLHDRGYKRLWGAVEPANRPARWIYSTRGYVPMWSVRRRRILMVGRTTREPS